VAGDEGQYVLDVFAAAIAALRLPKSAYRLVTIKTKTILTR
jgi:hypothetical protein